MTEIRLSQVNKAYGDVKVIHGIDLAVSSGEFCVFVGPSGCGKSTLLRIIAGLEDITSGEVIIDGEMVNQIPASERGLAMVFQSYALYPHMSIYKNMAFGLENSKLPRAEIDLRVKTAARMLQLEDYLERKPKALSGGQRQRVAIGRAIVREPRAFLFDEPLSNLDAELRVTMRKELAALHASIGGTMIYVTHDQVEAMTLADKIVVLQDGLIEQIGTPLELYNKPQNAFVAGFIGSPRMNIFEANVKRSTDGFVLHLGDATIAVPLIEGLGAGRTCSVGIRPEHLDITTESTADMVASCKLSEQLGGETYLYCEAGDLKQITVHRQGQLAIAKGERVPLRIDRASLHIFDENGVTLANGVAT